MTGILYGMCCCGLPQTCTTALISNVCGNTIANACGNSIAGLIPSLSTFCTGILGSCSTICGSLAGLIGGVLGGGSSGGATSGLPAVMSQATGK